MQHISILSVKTKKSVGAHPGSKALAYILVNGAKQFKITIINGQDRSKAYWEKAGKTI